MQWGVHPVRGHFLPTKRIAAAVLRQALLFVQTSPTPSVVCRLTVWPAASSTWLSELHMPAYCMKLSCILNLHMKWGTCAGVPGAAVTVSGVSNHSVLKLD